MAIALSCRRGFGPGSGLRNQSTLLIHEETYSFFCHSGPAVILQFG